MNISQDTEKAVVVVSHYGESKTHYALLVDQTIKDGKIIGFSRREWYSKNVCTLERVPGDPELTTYEWVYELTAPVWLLKRTCVKYEQKTN